ncbi:hypothetical protein Q1695_010247 [Nippostrongylus brasiliensis]|nr:hypothetical protein Q1695_010247 [Nippostrongylus brasiliensis]
MDSKKEEALLFWFNIYGKSVNLSNAPSLGDLWRAHVPSISHCLATDNNKTMIASTPSEAYHDLYNCLLKESQQETILECLSVPIAANGNHFEIAKFLAVVLNELRISKPEIIEDSIELMKTEGLDEPLNDIFSALDDDHDRWWSVMLQRDEMRTATESSSAIFQTPHRPTSEEFSGMSVSRSTFATPLPNRCQSRRRNNNEAHTVARCEGSPLLEALNSPKVRELRREREIRSLRKQLHEAEDQLTVSNLEAAESKRKIESLIEEVITKKERIRKLEANEKLLVREKDELENSLMVSTTQLDQLRQEYKGQQEMISKFKSGFESWEKSKNRLSEQLEAKNQALIQAESRLRDLNDELNGIQQMNQTFETENDNLKKSLEEARQSAEAERKEYQVTIADWRRRYESETAQILSLYNGEMENNAELQLKLREKAEQVEAIQKRYDGMKQQLENKMDDIKKTHQEMLKSATDRVSKLEEELARQEERYNSLETEHGANVQQLLSVHQSETNKSESRLRAAHSRIDELESTLAETRRAMLEHRKAESDLSVEKDQLSAQLSNLQKELEEKDSLLCDADSIVDKLKRSLSSAEEKCEQEARSAENLRAEIQQLQSTNDEKSSEMASMQQRIDELTQRTELYEKVVAELDRCKSDLAEQLVINEDLKNKSIFVEELNEKLEEMKIKSSHQAEKITQLENSIEHERKKANESEERWKHDCDELRAKEAQHASLLSELCAKINVLERDLAVKMQRCAERELRILVLEEENEQYKKCIEMSSNASSSVATMEKSKENGAATDSVVTSAFQANEDEPVLNYTIDTNGNEVQIPAVSTLFHLLFSRCNQFQMLEETLTLPSEGQVPSNPPPARAAEKDNPRSLPTASIFGSTSTLPRSSTSRTSLKENTLPPMPPKDVHFDLETDRARISELQKRNANVHPAMRCAYATEVTTYCSPSASENAVKHGATSERRKSGVKPIFQRASSYVKKRLPLSESTSNGNLGR